MKRLGRGIFLSGVMMIMAVEIVKAGNPPDQGHSSLSTSGSVPADGQTQATIFINMSDSSGNPVSGDSISLTDPNNSSAVIDTTQGTTDDNGQAIFTMTSTNPGTDSLTVIDNTANVTFGGLGTVQFDVAPTPTQTPVGYCGDSIPGIPQLTGATAKSSTQISLTWTDAADPVSHYLIAYGTATGQYIYGNPNVGGQGTTSYTVGSLTPGRTYYFAVEAVHGCATGGFSNELAGYTGSSGTTSQTVLPTTGPAVVTTTYEPIPTVSLRPVPTMGIIITSVPDQLPEADLSPTPEPVQTSLNGDQLKMWALIIPIVAGVGTGWWLVEKKK
jgi:hypothetical protein